MSSARSSSSLNSAFTRRRSDFDARADANAAAAAAAADDDDDDEIKKNMLMVTMT